MLLIVCLWTNGNNKWKISKVPKTAVVTLELQNENWWKCRQKIGITKINTKLQEKKFDGYVLREIMTSKYVIWPIFLLFGWGAKKALSLR